MSDKKLNAVSRKKESTSMVGKSHARGNDISSLNQLEYECENGQELETKVEENASDEGDFCFEDIHFENEGQRESVVGEIKKSSHNDGVTSDKPSISIFVKFSDLSEEKKKAAFAEFSSLKSNLGAKGIAVECQFQETEVQPEEGQGSPEADKTRPPESLIAGAGEEVCQLERLSHSGTKISGLHLPDKAPELFDENKEEDAITFYWRVWGKYAEEGLLYQFMLNGYDKVLMKKLRNLFRRRNIELELKLSPKRKETEKKALNAKSDDERIKANATLYRRKFRSHGL